MSASLTTEDAFLESCLHDDYVILGRKMQVFCLEMWCILKALKSPLLIGGTITIKDMQLAVLACSTSSMSEFYQIIRKPTFLQRCWWIITKGMPVAPVLKQFNTYIEDYVPNFPRIENTDGGFAAEFKCPDIFLCAAKLFAAGHSDREISRELALGKLLSWKMAIEESQGNPLDYVPSERDLEAIRLLNGEGK